MKKFQGRNILVIGAYSGIGQVVAQKLVAEGAYIVGVGRDEKKLQEWQSSITDSKPEIVVADASQWEQISQVVSIGKRLGGFSGLVVCAGLHELRPLSVLDSESLTRAFQANVATALMATRAFSKTVPKTGGSAVWISSVAAVRGTATFTAYAAAKGALLSASKVAAVELASRATRVNVIEAGVVKTEMSQRWLAHLSEDQQQELAKSHLFGIGQPEDVADVIVFLLSDDSRWMTGSVVTVDGGLSAH